MSINEGEIDLDLATSSNNSSGAGVNANSRVDMGFAVSDPISELVWSPHNGLRLKCADSALDDKKSIPAWNLMPSTKCLSASLSVRPMRTGEVRVGENKLTLFQNVLKRENRSVDCDSSMSSAQQFEVCKHEVVEAGPINAIRNEEVSKDGGEDDVCSQQHVEIAQTNESSKENTGQYGLADETRECKVGIIDGQLLRNSIDVNVGPSSSMCLTTTKFSVLAPVNLLQALEPEDKVISTPEEVGKTQMPSPVSLLQNRELSGQNDLGQFSAENDLSHMTAKLTHGACESKHPSTNPLYLQRSPTNSRICLQTDKGKERASSEGDIYGRSSNDENDSNGSVESCTSAGLFTKGSKRERCDQELIVGNKRMKHEGFGSTSIFGHDSSFMNWISNMVKGLSDSNKPGPSSLALAVAGPSNVEVKDCQENFTHIKDSHDSSKLPKGFHTIFQSMYGRNTKKFDAQEDDKEKIREDMKELTVTEFCENLSVSVDRQIDDSCKQIVLSDIVCQPNKTLMPSFAFESDMPENRNQGARSSSHTSSKRLNCSTDDNLLTTTNVPEKSNHLASLWITRFYTATSKLENSNQIASEAHGNSAEYLSDNNGLRIGKAFPSQQTNCVLGHCLSEDHVHVREKVIQEIDSKAKASVNLNSSTKPNSSVTKKFLAPAFARQLDALKNITPSDGRKFSTCRLNCFFCGRVGHDISDCPEITETELDELLKKLCFMDRVEEFRCLCIRCLQLGHWAVSCPLVSSSKHWKLEQNTACVNSSTAKFLQLFAGKEKSLSCVGDEQDHVAASASQPVCRSRMPRFGSLLSFATWNMKEPGSEGNSASINIQNHDASTSENDLKMCQSLPLHSLVSIQNKVPSAEMFHAIRKLRLSRSDVLKWMSSNLSLLHLNGHFLRLRLGKMESGLGGTGYYVARVTGVAREYIGRMSNKSIMVDVGGMKSSVGSQYISNQDFSEDEIEAWWQGVVKSGGKIPSLDELRLKFEDRTSLGL